MIRAQCLITGCKLLLSNEGMMCHGDLHIIGRDTFIFNAVLLEGEARRKSTDVEALMRDSQRCILIDGADCFERRGILVFHRTSALFNDAAKEHVEEALTVLLRSLP